MEITTRIGCRVRCTYCPQSTLIAAYKKRSTVYEMSPDTFQTCLSKIPPEIAIHFLGMAEPWLNPACTQMVLLAHRTGHAVSVSTTLAGMTPPDVDILASVPFAAFILHLPGNDGRMNLRVDTAYVDLLKKICAGRIQNLKKKQFGEVHPGIASIVESIPEVRWPTMNRANNLQTETASTTAKKSGRIHCHRKRNNVLLPNGDVALCCNDYGLKHILGNLLSDSYESLFKGKVFKAVRAGMQDDASEILCRYCSEPCMKIR